ncbi:MAG: hypothetical protein ACOC2Z_12740 [Coleofasciculus sp.]
MISREKSGITQALTAGVCSTQWIFTHQHSPSIFSTPLTEEWRCDSSGNTLHTAQYQYSKRLQLRRRRLWNLAKCQIMHYFILLQA